MDLRTCHASCRVPGLANSSATFLLVGTPCNSWLWGLNALSTLSTGSRERVPAAKGIY